MCIIRREVPVDDIRPHEDGVAASSSRSRNVGIVLG